MSQKVLSKNAIRWLRLVGNDPILCDMAERERRHYRQRRRDERRKPKTHTKPTDYLTVEQFAEVMDYFEGDLSGRKSLTKMLIILLVESGLRAKEAIDLRMEDMPSYHSHQAINIEKGKGRRPRSIVISRFLADLTKNYAGTGWTKTQHFLKNEQSKKFSYKALYQRIKRVGIAVGIPWLSPHKFRHTFGTQLDAVGCSSFSIKSQMGHRQKDVTSIYVHGDEEILRCEMEKFHNQLWCCQKGLFSTPNR